MVAVRHIVGAVATVVDVDVVVVVLIGQAQFSEAPRMEYHFLSRFDSFAESDACLETERQFRVDGQFAIDEQGSHFFRVESRSHIKLSSSLRACLESH